MRIKLFLKIVVPSLILTGLTFEKSVAAELANQTSRSDSTLIKAFKDILSETKLGASVNDPIFVIQPDELIVLLHCQSKASDQTLKIDAILTAKELLYKSPKKLDKIKIIFKDPTGIGRFVTVNRAMIEQFAARKISPEQFLKSTSLISLQEQNEPDLVPGVEFERRVIIWQRIQNLQKNGTNVLHLKSLFASAENLLQSGNKINLDKCLVSLEQKLGEQEEQLNQARKIASGRGIKGNVNYLRREAIVHDCNLGKPLSQEEENCLMSPSQADFDQFRNFLNQPQAGLLRLLPREKYDGKLKTRGGGAFYSFSRQVQIYGNGSNISLEQGLFRSGFAGHNYGFYLLLGNVPLDTVNLTTPGVPYMNSYIPKSSDCIRFENQVKENGFIYSSKVIASVDNTYVLRSIDFSGSDILVAFKVLRVDSDGSLIILWKILENYQPPTG